MIKGPTKPKFDDYENMYPKDRLKEKNSKWFWQSSFARTLLPSYADYTLKSPLVLEKPELPHRFHEHQGH